MGPGEKVLKKIIILVADDDPEDRELIQDAIRQNKMEAELRFVDDGEQLMDYLLRRGPFQEEASAPTPGLILLDLNMPKKDGREALTEIKSHSALRPIPVVVLTTSKSDSDVLKTYDLGVNSFISKPMSFSALIQIMGELGRYWLGVVELPVKHRAEAR